MNNYPFETNKDIDDQRSGIYALVNIKNGKFYIGSAVHFKKRMWLHKWELKNNVHKNIYLQNSYNKHGKDYFVYKIIEYVSDLNELLNIEQYYIDLYKPTGKTYNICPIAGNCLGRIASEEEKEYKSKNSKQSIEVWQMNKHTYEVVNVFHSLGEAERITGIHSGKISGVCSGKRNYTYDFIWRYSN